MNPQTADKPVNHSKRHIQARKARFVLINPDAQEVFVAGSFNDWNPTTTPLLNIGHGRWVRELSLPVGRYEYQFVVDGRWTHDRASRELVDNPLGGMDSVLEVQRPQFQLTARHSATHINPKWAWHYHALLKLRKRLLKDRLQQISELAGPLEPHSMHLADTATDEFAHELAIRELGAGQNLLYDVERAIQRTIDGTYGKCELTGKPIPAARLRAVPWAPFSKDVEAEIERLRSTKSDTSSVTETRLR
jgi:RNA polymerase-binding transcription factor DksA